MQEDLRMLRKRQGQDSDSDSDTSSTRRRRKKGPSYLEQELAKYSRGRGRAARTARDRKDRRDNDDDLLKDLGKFSKKVLALDDEDQRYHGDDVEGDGDEVLEVDDDVDWMRHALKFEHEVSDETRRAEDEYTVSWIWIQTNARSLTPGPRPESLQRKRGRTRQEQSREIRSSISVPEACFSNRNRKFCFLSTWQP